MNALCLAYLILWPLGSMLVYAWTRPPKGPDR